MTAATSRIKAVAPQTIGPLKNEAGATMVEASIVLPFLLFLISAIISFSQVLYSRLIINDALRIAGRAAVMSPVRQLSGGGASCEATAEAAFRQRMNRFGITIGANSLNVYRQRYVGTAGSPDVLGIRLNPGDVRVSCVLCGILQMGGVDYRPNTSQFVPFESEVHTCWSELPDVPTS